MFKFCKLFEYMLILYKPKITNIKSNKPFLTYPFMKAGNRLMSKSMKMFLHDVRFQIRVTKRPIFNKAQLTLSYIRSHKQVTDPLKGLSPVKSYSVKLHVNVPLCKKARAKLKQGLHHTGPGLHN